MLLQDSSSARRRAVCGSSRADVLRLHGFVDLLFREVVEYQFAAVIPARNRERGNDDGDCSVANRSLAPVGDGRSLRGPCGGSAGRTREMAGQAFEWPVAMRSGQTSPMLTV